MPEAVIVDAVRTPVGRAFKGSLASLRPDETLAFVVDQLLERNPDVDPAAVEELIAGCGLPQGLQANNIARIAVLLSDKLTQTTNGSTVNRYCASGLDAIRNAANAVVAGQGDIYIAGGVEFVSRYNAAQEAAHPEDQNEKLQGKEPGQPNAYIAMGLTAENVAEKYGVSREDQDRYAQRSQERAVAAQEAGVFDREIVPVTLADGTVVSKDDGPRASSTYEKLATLEPAFKPGGTVTAGNSCPLNDGAAAALIMSAEKAAELGLRPRARVITAATWGNEPEYMGVAPIGAIRKALDRAGHERFGHRHHRAQRGVRGAGAADRVGGRDRPRHAQPARRRDRARPPVRHDRRPDHDDAAERPRDARQDDRARDHVRRPGSGRGADRRAAELRDRIGAHGLHVEAC